MIQSRYLLTYPSVIQSTDGQVIYCAFDSLYDTGLSDLLGGPMERKYT